MLNFFTFLLKALLCHMLLRGFIVHTLAGKLFLIIALRPPINDNRLFIIISQLISHKLHLGDINQFVFQLIFLREVP